MDLSGRGGSSDLAALGAPRLNRRQAIARSVLGCASFMAGCGGGGSPSSSPDAGPSPAPAPSPAASGDSLPALAAGMTAGSWASLSVPTQDAVLGVGNVSGSMIHFCNSMPWNAKTGAIEIIGADHNWGSARHVQFVVATSQFVLLSNNATGEVIAHGYDHTDVNPGTGDVYHRLYGDGTLIHTLRKAPGTASFAPIPDVATSYAAVALGTCWWSGSFAGAGSQGCWMVFNSGASNGSASDGQVVAFDPLAGRWVFDRDGMAPNFSTQGETYHSVMEYSVRGNVAVYGGGNDQPRKLWRLDADGSRTALTDVPAGKAVGIQHGNLVSDPVSGNFLLLSAGELWELDPGGAGTWTPLTGSRLPPAGVGVPGPGTPEGVVSCALPEHGVVAYITQSSSSGGTFFLYKHA